MISPDPPAPICKKVGCDNIATHQKSEGIFRTCEQHQLAQKWTRICMEETCINKALYAWPGKPQTACCDHYADGMRNPYIIYCIMCDRDSSIPPGEKKQATFGRDCRKPSFCRMHNHKTQYTNVIKADCRDGCILCSTRRGMVFDETRNVYFLQ
jgi:hypothetical protein